MRTLPIPALLLVLLSLGAGGAWAQPVITTQPVGQTVNPGSSVSLTVVATGATSYQWWKDGTAVASGTSASLSFASAQGTDSGNYYVVVASNAGYASSVTVALTVKVVAPPAFTSPGSTTVPLGAAFTFTITATGLPTSFGAAGLPPGLSLDDSTGIISGTATAQGTYSVSISATNAIGQTAGTLALTVAREPSLYAVFGYNLTEEGALFLFTGPTSVAINSSGASCVADPATQTIRDAKGAIIAGQSGLVGAADGSSSLFFKPSGVAIDGSGAIYVADTGNDTIRVVSTTHVVSTLAGSAQQAGSADGDGSLARFNGPTAIAVDSQGNVFVADTGNQTIRKVTPAGAVSTFAGSPGQSGSADGTGAAARFNAPLGVAVDGNGNVYVADSGNETVREITPGGVVSTLAGSAGQTGASDGLGAAARFTKPTSVAVDPSGNVFVLDGGAFREIFAGGQVVSLGGFTPGYDIGQIPQPFPFFFPQGLSNPAGLAVDQSGNLCWLNSGPSGSGFVLLEAYPYVPVHITSAPSDQTLVSGTSTLFSVTATGEPLNYAWYGPRWHELNFDEGTNLVSSSSSFEFDASLSENLLDLFTDAGSYEVFVYNVGSVASVGFNVAVTPQPPTITSQPSSETAVVGQSVTFSVAASSAYEGGFSLAWYFNGVPIPGADGLAYSISNVQPSDAGYYSVTAFENLEWLGMYPSQSPIAQTSSDLATLTVIPASAPQIAAQPQSVSVDAGGAVTFSVLATGAPSPTYQWSYNGTPIAGATGASYSIPHAQVSNSGAYSVAATNGSSSVTSQSAFLTVSAASGGPAIAGQPQSYSTYPGATIVLTVALSTVQAQAAAPRLETDAATAATYQWYYDGVALSDGGGISGSQTPTLMLSGSATKAGSYVCLIENSAGSVMSQASALAVSPIADIGRLINVSCRAMVEKGSGILIAGFVVGGGGTSGSQQLLIRGSGPALIPFDVAGTLPDPELQLFSTASGSDLLATNTGWGGNPQITGAAVSVGAFAWAVYASHDAALLQALPPGPYTANVAGQSGDSGVALAEVYDATPEGAYTPATPHLVNISARVQVGTGGDALIAGFVIGGSTSKTVLIRASGPALAPFGVAGTLPDPELKLYKGNSDGTSTLLGSNLGWGGDSQIAATAASVGAFPWGASDTLDSAILVTLAPGAYTAQVSGAGGDTGVALVEVYEVQ